jgi:hypothetical protein
MNWSPLGRKTYRFSVGENVFQKKKRKQSTAIRENRRKSGDSRYTSSGTRGVYGTRSELEVTESKQRNSLK